MKKVVVGPLSTNCYIVEVDEKVVVIDPGGDPEKIAPLLEGKKVSAIVATHGHFDHVLAVGELKRRTGAPFYMHYADIEIMEGSMALYAPAYEVPRPDYDLADGLEGFEVIHTPGHTPGSACLLRGKLLFSGDTLFKGAVGRHDLPGGSKEELMLSIRRLVELGDDTEVYPGHGQPTSIGYEKRSNPYILLWGL